MMTPEQIALAQPLFDEMVRGLAAQGWERAMSAGGGACEYRGAEGRKCAIGQLISDESALQAGGKGFTSAYLKGRFTPNDAVKLQPLWDIEVNSADGTLSSLGRREGERLGRELQHLHDLSHTPEKMKANFQAAALAWGLAWPEGVE